MSIAAKIGCAPQTLNDWVKKAEVDSGKRTGVSNYLAVRVKYTFVFLANFTYSKTPFFQHGAKAGNEGTVHHVFKGVVVIAEAFIGAPVHG